MTYREVAYNILDQVRLLSDDISLNEEHALFLADKFRAQFLVQKYKTIKRQVSEANYQVICSNLEEFYPGGSCFFGDHYLRSVVKMPLRMGIGNDVVMVPTDSYAGINISLVSYEQMKYAGHGRFSSNIIYCSIGPDGYLYMKSTNPSFRYLKAVRFYAVFESSLTASNMSCDDACEDLMDRTFPLEEALAAPVMEAVIKELSGAAYKPHDERNNANDDSGKVVAAAQ